MPKPLHREVADVHLHLDPELHRRMQVVAASLGLKVWEVYEAALRFYLRGACGEQNP